MKIEERTSAHLYLDDNPIGPYVALLDITEGMYSVDNERRYYTLTLPELEALRLHLDNTLDALKARMLRDAIGGNCMRCKNVRMIDVERHGQLHRHAERCPSCVPRINAVMDALNEGRPPKSVERR